MGLRELLGLWPASARSQWRLSTKASDRLPGSLGNCLLAQLFSLGPGGNEATESGSACLSPSLPRPNSPLPISLFPFRRSRPNLSQTELIYFSCGLALGGAREQHVITLSKYYSSAEN